MGRGFQRALFGRVRHDLFNREGCAGLALGRRDLQVRVHAKGRPTRAAADVLQGQATRYDAGGGIGAGAGQRTILDSASTIDVAVDRFFSQSETTCALNVSIQPFELTSLEAECVRGRSFRERWQAPSFARSAVSSLVSARRFIAVR